MQVSNNQRGLSIVELAIAAGILSAMALAAVSVGSSIFKPLQDLTKNIYDSIGSDISVRSLAFQFSNSEVMRGAPDGTPWVTCSGKTTLAPGQAKQSTTLNAKGDSYSFAFTRMRSLGATNVKGTNTLSVPDTARFQVGMDVLITSLDSSKSEGMFVVTAIDSSAQTISVSDSVVQPPGEFGCKILSKTNATVLFNPAQLKKFSIESISLVKYVVEDQPGQNGQLRLMGESWPATGLGATDFAKNELAPNFISMQIVESFSSASTSKGFYSAAFTLTRWNTKVRNNGAAVQSSISATAGYALAGVEITNGAAVPAPPSVDNLFVTCGLATSVQYANYIDGDPTSPTVNNVIAVYRIDPFYSENDVIRKQAPQFSTAFSTTGTEVRCWQATQVDCSNTSSLPVLKGAPTKGGVTFSLLVTPPPCVDTSDGPDMVPVLCAIPNAALAASKLNYSSPTAGPQTAKCSDAQLAGLTINWSYDGAASHCSNDGSIFLGRLINAATNPAGTGPLLGIKPNSCKWTGSTSSSCNAVTVLKKDPGAKLQEVRLTPEGTNILNGSTTLSCN